MEKKDIERLKVPAGTMIKANGLSYQAGAMIGFGSFGIVFEATTVETGEVVAIKKVLQDRRFKNRELQIIRVLNHPNVVTLKNSFYTAQSEEEVYLNLVLDYVPKTAFQCCRSYVRNKARLPMIYVKLYAYQMSRALGYLHGLGISHRDIKPQNLLVDESQGILRLCDFGSAKSLVPGEPSTSYICSRFYRAPELIFGSPLYTQAIDLWSMGCVIAEFMLMEPLFIGDDGVDQLVEIIKVLGTPTKDQILIMNRDYKDFSFPIIQPYPWTSVFPPETPSDAIDLLTKLIVYEPHRRLHPFEVCAHPFFDELRDQKTVLPNGNPLPSTLFTFTAEELGSDHAHLMDKLVPAWVAR